MQYLQIRDFLGGPIVKNPSCNSRNTCLIPGEGTKIHEAHTLQLLGLWTLEAVGHNSRAHVPKPLSLNSAVRVHVPQQKILHDVMKILYAITKTLLSQINYLKKKRIPEKSGGRGEKIKYPVRMAEKFPNMIKTKHHQI